MLGQNHPDIQRNQSQWPSCILEYFNQHRSYFTQPATSLNEVYIFAARHGHYRKLQEFDKAYPFSIAVKNEARSIIIEFMPYPFQIEILAEFPTIVPAFERAKALPSGQENKVTEPTLPRQKNDTYTPKI
jgi:hypothetical protein